jgi:hypothetical protein
VRLEKKPDGYDYKDVSAVVDKLDAVLDQLTEARTKLVAMQKTAGQQNTAVHNLMKNPGELDGLMDKLRVRHKKSPLKKRFVNLAVIESRADFPFSDITTVVDTLIDAPNFKTQTALRIGFEHGDLGHSVAAYQLPAGGYYLFDPNYGIFKMDKKGVKAALVYLARDLYTEDAPLQANVDYELFGKA